MTSIKIKTDFTGILYINDKEIKAFDNFYQPKSFNLHFRNDKFYIHDGNDYEQYTWGTDYTLSYLKVVHGLCYIDMVLDLDFILSQHNSKVYLPSFYIQSGLIKLIKSTLYTHSKVDCLELYMDNSVINIGINQSINLFADHSLCHFDMNSGVVKNIKEFNSKIYYEQAKL